MARGFESKSIQSQVEDRRVELEEKRTGLPAQELEREKKRDSLEMSRIRVSNELKTSRAGVHRTALENALAFLDGELKKLETKEPAPKRAHKPGIGDIRR